MSAAEPIRPSDLAQGLAQVVPSLGSDVVRELRTLLTHHVETETPARGRWTQLRLLVALVSETGEVIPVATYAQAREKELAAGRHAPSAAALCDDYGSWLSAVRAAIRFAFGGSSSRVPRHHKHCHRHESFTPREVLMAIRRARQLYDAWPTEWEYGEWAQLDRELKRASGTEATLPRTPGLGPVHKLFDDYATALCEARAWEEGSS